MSFPSRNLYQYKQVACSVVVACYIYPLFFILYYCTLLLLVYFFMPFYFFILMLLLYFCLIVDLVNKPIIFVFGAFVYHFKKTISIFVTILTPLNVMNRFKLEQYWDLLTIYFQNKDNWSEITRNCRRRFSRREGRTVSGILKFVANVRGIGFMEMHKNVSVLVQRIHPKILKLLMRVFI